MFCCDSRGILAFPQMHSRSQVDSHTVANDPKLILADEPTGNLDPETAEEVFGFLKELNDEGRTVVLVTHDPNSAARCKRTLKLRDAKLLESMPRDELANQGG